MKSKLTKRIESLLATVKCAWSLAVFNFENWLDSVRYPNATTLANDAPSSTGRSLTGLKTYCANSTQVVQTGTTAQLQPWANRYNVVIMGQVVAGSVANTLPFYLLCYLGQTAGEVPLGICWDTPDLPGDPLQVAIPDALAGTSLVYATGVIAAGTLLMSNGDGTVTAWTSSTTHCSIGYALTPSTATGDYIEMSLSLNAGSGQTTIAAATGCTI
jgi:hypothetical protein